MAIQFPNELQILLDFYSIRWPDVDEDQVRELGDHIHELAANVTEFSAAIHRLLEVLSHESKSEALDTLVDAWDVFTNDQVVSVVTGIGEGGRFACTTAADIIVGYKTTLIAYLMANLVADAIALSTGVGAAAVVAKKALAKAILQQFLDFAAAQAVSWLVSQWNDAVETMILDPIEDMARAVGTELGGGLRRAAVMAVPTHQVGVGLARLYIDYHDVIDAVAAVKRSYDGVASSVGKLRHWSKGTGFVTLTPSPDPLVRIELKKVVDWTVDAICDQLENIGADIVNKIADTITEIYDKYCEADQTLARLASDLKEQMEFPPVPAPFVIDRSTRPRPIMVLDAPPPVVTGEAVSDARFDISVIDLADPAEVVVTGPGESDARFDIKVIDLPDIPEPVEFGAD